MQVTSPNLFSVMVNQARPSTPRMAEDRRRARADTFPQEVASGRWLIVAARVE